MKDSSHSRILSEDDPRLTAYALGELDGDECEQVAAEVAAYPELQVAVKSVRDTAAQLSAALEGEEAGASGGPVHMPAPVFANQLECGDARRKSMRRFPWWIAGGLVAASLALVALLSLHTDWGGVAALDKEAKNHILVDVTALPPALALQPDSKPGQTSAPEAEESRETPVEAELYTNDVVVAEQNSAATGDTIPEALKVVTLENPLDSPSAGRLSLPPPSGTFSQRPRISASSSMIAAGNEPAHAVGFRLPDNSVPLRANFVQRSFFPENSPRRLPSTQGGAEFNTEAYDRIVENAFLAVAGNPLSTFSVDVDTASYSNVRRMLMAQGRRPPPDAVRIEEMLNSFSYNYAPPPAGEETPFAAHIDAGSAPWAPGHRLVRVGLKGREVSVSERPAANLVFLLDVSGSMRAPNKLPLVKDSMRGLISKLEHRDRVAIAVYAGASGLELPSTPASESAVILAAIDQLTAGGSTNGAMGIHLAYDVAKANFIEGGINRVILATDGDFNVGVTDRGSLQRLIEEKAKSGVFLTVLGFGMGNLKDATLEQLANKGNGAYAYIDDEREAQRVMVEQGTGLLYTIAKDVKVQVEFNPARVQAYRLIGYENRVLAREDFNNDRIDAGEIGAGHTVTALYEIIPTGVDWKPDSIEALKYQPTSPRADAATRGRDSAELLTIKMRYKQPDGDESRLLSFPFTDPGTMFAEASGDFKFAAAVAGFGMVLRDSPHKGTTNFNDVIAWAAQGLGPDRDGRRGEFIDLVRAAQKIPM